MDKNELAEQLKYSSSDCILIVTCENQLKKLYTPFKVYVLNTIGSLSKGEVVLVTQVKVTKRLIIIFIIDGNAYYYYHFDILID
tara:strand:- start:542 stop:793 length:252 start_codon:yes stop_codon:yes gene_type:complete